jgi:hypothetical protein
MSLKKSLHPLEKGQIWQLGETRIEIVEVGKTLTHFKHFKTINQKRVPVELKGIPIVQEYLKVNKAKLIQEAPKAPALVSAK